MSRKDIVNLLYEQKGDFTINNVEFHKFILNEQEYFKGFFNFNKDETEMTLKNEDQQPFSYESIIYLKMKLYHQKINFELQTIESAELLIDLEKISDLLQLEIISVKKLYTLTKNCKNMEILKLLYLSIPGLTISEYFQENIDTLEFKFNMNNPIHMNIYAYCLSNSKQCKDEKKAFELYKTNWEENKNLDSLYNYADCIMNGKGCERDEKKAFELHKMNWQINGNANSLQHYALFLFEGKGGCKKDEKKGCRLFKLNWEDNDYLHSLYSYAHCLMYGEGCEKDEKEAIKLFKLGCEKNHPNSIHTCAVWTMEGLKGCKKDEKEAFRLFKLNWEENKYKYGLDNYIYCLKNGKGCEKDQEKADKLSENSFKK